MVVTPGIPAMVQWIKNPAATAWIAAEVQIQSLAQELQHAEGVAKKINKIDN